MMTANEDWQIMSDDAGRLVLLVSENQRYVIVSQHRIEQLYHYLRIAEERSSSRMIKQALHILMCVRDCDG
ncbi:MAG: hypothetical protein HC828_01820 [Blastochloris sp.]|nr:hypothetical protein [Blastochloris sp.]